MAALGIRPVVRAILETDPNLPAEEVIKRAKGRGLKVPDENIRKQVHNLKSEMKKAATGAKPTTPAKPATAPRPAPAAARQTPTPAAMPAPAAPKPAAAATTSGDLSAVFANVALVNQVVATAGGVDHARQVAEAVRACGSVDAFLQHLDLVAGIRTAGPGA